MAVYEARNATTTKDFDTMEAAKAWVEATNGYRIVKFVVWPDGQHKSCAMETYSDGVWAGHDITR